MIKNIIAGILIAFTLCSALELKTSTLTLDGQHYENGQWVENN